MKSKKKGFTLLELLGVIVILAITLVIAVPRVVNVVEESKKESLKISGENLIKAAEQDHARQSFNPPIENTYTIEDGAFVGESLSISGSLPESGTIKVKSDGTVGIALIKDGYCVIKGFGDEQSTLTNDIANCILYEDTPEVCFQYTVYGEEVEITGYDGDCTQNLVIPKKLEDKTVTGIGDFAFASFGCYTLKDGRDNSLLAYNGDYNKLAYIDNCGLTKLLSVRIPDTVQYIGEFAFTNNQISSLTIPNSVEEIGFLAFADNQITSLVLSDGIEYIGEESFYNNQLTSIVIPDSVIEIDWYAFGGNQLTSVTTPEGISILRESISQPFYYTYSSTYFGAGGEYISTCQDCEWTHATLPVPTLATTPVECFEYTSTATNVTITGYDNTCTSYIKIPETIGGKPVEHIGNEAFREFYMTPVFNENINGLLTFNDDKMISRNVDSFAYTEGPNSDFKVLLIILPSTLISIGEYAFYENDLSTIVIPNSVTSISNRAFYANYNLFDITMPGNVTLGTKVFNSDWTDSFNDMYNGYYNKEAGIYIIDHSKCSWINSSSALPPSTTDHCDYMNY